MAATEDIIKELQLISGSPDTLGEAETKKRVIRKYNPFKRYSPIGPGPDHDFGTRAVKRKLQWKCSKASKYVQSCVGVGSNKGVKKTIRIKPDYKKSYNHAYKAWVAKKNKS